MKKKDGRKPKGDVTYKVVDPEWGTDATFRIDRFDDIARRMAAPQSDMREEWYQSEMSVLAAALEETGREFETLLAIDGLMQERGYWLGIRDGVRLAEGKKTSKEELATKYLIDDPEMSLAELVERCDLAKLALPPSVLAKIPASKVRVAVGAWKRAFVNLPSRPALEKYVARLRKRAHAIRQARELYEDVLHSPQLKNLKLAVVERKKRAADKVH